MSQLPNGPNPYGRLLDLMMKTKGETKGIVKGEYLGDGKFSIGGHTFDLDEVLLIQNHITVDGKTFDIPSTETQAKTVTVGGDSFDVSVPKMTKGDSIVAYQFDDEEFVILGVI